MKTVLVTGCSSGIGYYTAKTLREEGYEVITTARKPEDIQRLKAEGYTCLYLDYADRESVSRLAEEVEKLTEGRLYSVFHNGAYGQPGAVEDLTREVLEEQFATNVFGWMQLTNLLIPNMRKHNEGRILFNSSVLGIVALRYRGAYNASKYAIEGFADTLRLELANTNIQIALIEPGPIESKFRQNSLIAFEKNINVDASVHKKNYRRELKRLKTVGRAVPFTLPADAVIKKVLHALKSKRAKPHYYVTFPTYLFGYLKRVLPTRWLDKLLLKV